MAHDQGDQAESRPWASPGEGRPRLVGDGDLEVGGGGKGRPGDGDLEDGGGGKGRLGEGDLERDTCRKWRNPSGVAERLGSGLGVRHSRSCGNSSWKMGDGHEVYGCTMGLGGSVVTDTSSRPFAFSGGAATGEVLSGADGG